KHSHVVFELARRRFEVIVPAFLPAAVRYERVRSGVRLGVSGGAPLVVIGDESRKSAGGNFEFIEKKGRHGSRRGQVESTAEYELPSGNRQRGATAFRVLAAPSRETVARGGFG